MSPETTDADLSRMLRRNGQRVDLQFPIRAQLQLAGNARIEQERQLALCRGNKLVLATIHEKLREADLPWRAWPPRVSNFSVFHVRSFPSIWVEAEVLGSKVNYYAHAADILYPTIIEHPAEKIEDLNIQVPSDLAKAGRIPVVTEALRLLKQEVGSQVAIGAWVLGPYTLAGQLVDLSQLAKAAFKKTDMLRSVLEKLAGVLIQIIKMYRAAGAD